MAIKWETKDPACGHVYHISFPFCPWCYELEEVTCPCCGNKKQRVVLTEEGKRVRAETSRVAGEGGNG